MHNLLLLENIFIRRIFKVNIRILYAIGFEELHIRYLKRLPNRLSNKMGLQEQHKTGTPKCLEYGSSTSWQLVAAGLHCNYSQHA